MAHKPTDFPSLAAEFFFSAVRETSCEELGLTDSPTCLADLIEWWVEYGWGVWACGGNPVTFQATVTVIIHKWLLNPDLQCEGTENITRIFDDDEGNHEILDPRFFEFCAFTTKNRHSGR